MAITKGQAAISVLSNCRKDLSQFLNEIRVDHYCDANKRSLLIVVIVRHIKDI